MIAPALALVAVFALATSIGPTADDHISDIGLYAEWAGLLSDGRLPYRDFDFEYPPLALVPMWLARLGPSYEAMFAALMLGALLVVQREAARLAGPRHERAVAWALVALPVAAGAIVRSRFDLVAVALALAGLRLALDGRRRTLGFVLLGLGGATKVFPLVVAAVAVAWLRGSHARRGAVAAVAACSLVCLPFAVLSPGGFAEQLSFHVERPVQIESTPATVLRALGDPVVTGTPARPDRFRSHGLDDGAAGALVAVFAVLQAAALLAALVLARRGDPVLAALAALLAFVALGKVLSPQFLLWLAPLAAVAYARGARAPAVLVGVATVLTQLEFPARYQELVAGDTGAVVLTGARNALLLAALTLLLARGAAPARSRPPGPAVSSG